MLYYREDLEKRECVCAACRRAMQAGPVYYHSQCHGNIPMWVRYEGGVLTVECASCKKEVLSVVVARWKDELHVRRRPELEDEERCP